MWPAAVESLTCMANVGALRGRVCCVCLQTALIRPTLTCVDLSKTVENPKYWGREKVVITDECIGVSLLESTRPGCLPQCLHLCPHYATNGQCTDY